MTEAAANESPLVSVVMAAYNAEEYVGAALESIYAQGYEPLEVVVVDDGSTDRTGEIVRSFPDVRYVHQENAGPASARNRAFAEARGEFVAVLDSDDLMAPGRIGSQAAYLRAHSDVGAVLGRQEWIDAPDSLPRDVVYGDPNGIPVGGAAMFRRSVLERLGGYDSSFVQGEDTDLLIRMRELGIRHEILPEVVLIRRYRPTSLTGGQSLHNNLLRSLRGKLDRDRDAEPPA
jgi:glycosyltransferase involved in cell wall biosynthesis